MILKIILLKKKNKIQDYKNMIENISTNEFMFFKNEVLSEFKKIEQKFTKILEEQNQEIIKKYNISEQRVKLL